MYVLDLGRRDYKEVWDLQKTVHEKRVVAQIPNTLILVEHDPVITMGRSGHGSSVLFPVESLSARGVAFYDIERGGDATFHGPGQLVGYPVFNVRDGLAGIKPFINKIEEVIIATLADFRIAACRKEKMVGVWAGERKICSIGIAVKRWVSFHGFALNVNTDLAYFDLIVPCGLKDIRMTSMQQISGREIAFGDVKQSVIDNFGVLFGAGTKRICLEEII